MRFKCNNVELVRCYHQYHVLTAAMKGFNTSTGALNHVVNLYTGRSWAAAGNEIGLFHYQSLSQQVFNTFQAQYNWCPPGCDAPDFGNTFLKNF